MVQSLIALQTGVIHKNTSIVCNKNKIGCHYHEEPTSLKKAIKHSCNPYFLEVYKRLILSKDLIITLKKVGKATKMGGNGENIWFWKPLGVDVPEEKGGFVPNVEFYDKW